MLTYAQQHSRRTLPASDTSASPTATVADTLTSSGSNTHRGTSREALDEHVLRGLAALDVAKAATRFSSKINKEDIGL